MLFKRRFILKWLSIIVAYICIFLLSYEYGVTQRRTHSQKLTREPRHLVIKRIFHDHTEYMNSSMTLKLVENELKHPLLLNVNVNTHELSTIHHGLVVYYDYSSHHLLFQQFLWLYSSWNNLDENSHISNDLIVFITSQTIPNDFKKLFDRRRAIDTNNRLIIYPCVTLTDSILENNMNLLNFSHEFQYELTRLFYWQQTRLSSLVLFIIDEYKHALRKYDYIFRFDIDSFFMPGFAHYEQRKIFRLGQTIPYDSYTINRLERIKNYFHSKSNSKILKQTLTINWFGKLEFISQLIRQVVLMALWLIKVEFTDSERLHHLTYLNYPSWYIDGIFEYATAIVLSLHQYDNYYSKDIYRFDCRHSLIHCLHISFRDPSHHLKFSKHSLKLLTTINQTNLTDSELYIYKTVVKANEAFYLYFA